MIYIPLAYDKFLIVDDDDLTLDIVIGVNWSQDRYGYVRMRKAKKSLYIHHLISGSNARCDHINRDRLDNRAVNLRPISMRDNRLNSKMNCDNTSGFRGVTAHHGKWQAQTGQKGKSRYLGLFNSKEDAATAYNFALFDPADPHRQLNVVPQPWLEVADND